MERKTLASIAAKSAPDVVNLNPQFSSRLAEFGALAEPENFLSASDIAEYLPAAWRANQLGGKTFAIPWYLNTNVTLFNMDLLKRSKVTVPASFQALLPAARLLKSSTATYAYFPAMDGSTVLETMVASGAPLLKDNGCRAGFIDDGGRRLFEIYRKLYQDALVPKNVVTEGHRKAVEMFLSGQIAMITTGMQFLSFIKNNNPDFYQRIGVAPQLGTAGGSPANIATMNLAVLQTSKNKKLAFAFARFLSNSENQIALAQRVPILPSTVASYQDASFIKALDDPLLEQARAISVKQVLSGATLVPPMRKYSKLRSSYVHNLQSVMLGQKSTAQALDDIDREWAAILGCKL
jgi:putative chitobiose transport system substrate-binding protein